MLDFTTLVSGMLLGTRSVKWVSRESGGLESAVYIHFSALYFLLSQTCVFFLPFNVRYTYLFFHILNGWAGESTVGMVFALEMEQWFNIISIISCDP